MPADQQTPGEEQEARVRSRLVAEGYEQPFGVSDKEIRRNLGFRGKCADFVGYHHRLDKWLIAESKGGNLEPAEAQLENTIRGLLARELKAKGKIELRIYISADQYAKLFDDPIEANGCDGYFLRGSDPYLGIYGFGSVWSYIEIEGIRVLTLREA